MVQLHQVLQILPADAVDIPMFSGSNSVHQAKAEPHLILMDTTEQAMAVEVEAVPMGEGVAQDLADMQGYLGIITGMQVTIIMI